MLRNKISYLYRFLYSMPVWVTIEKCTLALACIKGTRAYWHWPQSSEIQIQLEIVRNGGGRSHHRLLQRDRSRACWLFCQGRIQGENHNISVYHQLFQWTSTSYVWGPSGWWSCIIVWDHCKLGKCKWSESPDKTSSAKLISKGGCNMSQPRQISRLGKTSGQARPSSCPSTGHNKPCLSSQVSLNVAVNLHHLSWYKFIFIHLPT